MKKIGLICLALVFALGALGVGYAMWTDTITIDGTVKTGSVNIIVEEYSGTWMWKLPTVTEEDDWELTSDPDFNTNPVVDPQGWIVAYAEARQATTADLTPTPTVTEDIDDHVWVVFDNIFPLIDDQEELIPWEADFVCHYVGSVPVKVNFTPISIVGDPIPDTNPVEYYDLSDLIIDIAGYIWVVVEDPQDPQYPGYWAPISDEELEGTQLEYCDRIKFVVQITVPQYTEDQYPDTYEELNEANMGLHGTITGLIQVVQWNEYEPD